MSISGTVAHQFSNCCPLTKQIRSKRLLKEHGIWLPSNLAVGQEGQVIVLAFFLLLGVFGAIQSAEAAGDRRAELESEPPTRYTETGLYYIPEPWVIIYSFAAGLAVACIVGCCLILLYIPSTISTIMQLRTGRIKTLTNPKFEQYRSAAGEFKSIYFLWC